jgi:Papain family cysteine protease
MIEDELGFGYDPTIQEFFPVLRPRYVETLPSSYTVRKEHLPPIGQQGTLQSPGFPGSCAAWATTYGLATFTAAKATLVDPSTPAGQASPAFIYIQVLKESGITTATCRGSTFKPYFDQLAADGTPSMQTAPYVPNCSTLWQDYANASPGCQTAFRIGSVATIETNDLESLKHVLVSDRVLAYGTRLYTDWGSYRGDPVPYVGNGQILVNRNGKPAGHCMLIIGYDDAIGAVLIQNSEGTAWGSDGYVCMAYATFQALAQGQAAYVND